jgi:hypothetical protein
VDRRRRLLANAYEVLTGDVLTEAAQAWGASVAKKVRLSDALAIGGSGLTDEEYRYALMAHFDFVVVGGESELALFAVEFDGPHHDSDPGARGRDAMKESICRRLGMPLLRVREEYLLDVLHEPILGWLVSVWFLAEAFEPATGKPFNFRLTMMEPKDGPAQIMTFAPEARRRIFDFIVRDAGGPQDTTVDPDGKVQHKVTFWFPFIAMNDDPEGTGTAQAFALIRLRDGRGLAGRNSCRAVEFGRIQPGDIAGELALLDASLKIDALDMGQVAAEDALTPPDEFDALLASIRDWRHDPIFIPELPI